MIYCAKCGSKVGLSKPCKTCKARSDSPWLSKRASQAEHAKALKQELCAMFSDTKFSVKQRSGTRNVHIWWAETPDLAAVMQIAQRYVADASFNLVLYHPYGVTRPRPTLAELEAILAQPKQDCEQIDDFPDDPKIRDAYRASLRRNIQASKKQLLSWDNVETVLDGFQRGLFVRSTEGDRDPAWAIKLAPFIAALANLQREHEQTPLYESLPPVSRSEIASEPELDYSDHLFRY